MNSKKQKIIVLIVAASVIFVFLASLQLFWPQPELISRGESIPADFVKVTPDFDDHFPQLNSSFTSVWEDPVPMPGPINTAGVEDSPYITSDGDRFFFWFTPDILKGSVECINDGATGIYESTLDGNDWSQPERVFLGWDALDACPTYYESTLYFCSIREGPIDMWAATENGDDWTDIRRLSDNLGISTEIGEMHVTDGGNKIFYGHVGSDGLDYNISMIEKIGGEWQDPVSIDAVNTDDSENLPFVSSDGTELWFTRSVISEGSLQAPEVYRSVWTGTEWDEPDMIVTSLAGEPSLDGDGNLYFTHHFWNDTTSRMVESDIYVCYRK